MKNKYIYLVWFIALLPAMILRDYTPNNELRYLSIVDEALQNGSVFTFTNQGEIYADKPPLHFWLMMIGKLILGEHHMWYYSLLSFIPALVILMTMTKWIRKGEDMKGVVDNQIAAPLMLMTTGLFAGAALIVRMDMLMNMFIVLSLYSFYQMYKNENIKQNSWLFPIFVFLALFSKGPLGLLIPFVSTVIFLIYKKNLSDFKKYWGWKSFLIILAGSVVWFTGVYIEGGNDYLNNLLVHQTVGRGIDSFHHKEPVYYYLISIWYTLAPWSFLVLGLFVASLVKKRINTTLEQFFAVIILSTLVMLSLISSKLAIYSLPIVPFLIFITVLQIKKFDMQNVWIKLTIAIPAVIFILALPGIVYVSGMEGMQYLADRFIYIGAGVLTLTGILVFYFIYLKRDLIPSINTLALGFLLSVFLIGWSMPKLNNQLGWGNMCEKAKELSEEYKINDYWVYNISRSENMDVYLEKDIIKVEKEDLLNENNGNKLLMLRTKDIKNDPDISSLVLNKDQYQFGVNIIVILN
ncbi:MAG: glycosyltransferase family 39 protein [Fermentimonas sp.]|nr:glycosyltransferase family 39 protein [Fermentimonas sp.]